MRNIDALAIADIARHGSFEYISAVLQDLVDTITDQRQLAVEVLKLNPECTQIGAGRLANLIDLAKQIQWDS